LGLDRLVCIRRAGAHESDINSALRMSTDGKKVEPLGGFSDVSHSDVQSSVVHIFDLTYL
jgi:hypothetical protein